MDNNHLPQFKPDRETADELFSRAVKAGRRTYFFDVKATRGGDKYIVITESRKKQEEGASAVTYEKQKLYLYKEDFGKFIKGLREVVDFAMEGIEDAESAAPENRAVREAIAEPVLTLDEEFALL